MKIYIYVIVLLFLISCRETEIVLPESTAIGEPVPNSVFHNESPVSVYISRAIAPLDSMLNGASNSFLVSLLENGKFKELLSFNPATNAYQGTILPQPGNSYGLEVKEGANQPLRVSASTLLREKPQIRQMSFKDSSLLIGGEYYGTLSYTMDDSPGDQIYRLVIYYFNTSMARFVPLDYLTNDAVLRDTLTTIESERFFDDRGFKSGSHSFEVYIKSGNFYAFNNRNYLLVEHFALSQDFYNYYKSLNDYMKAGSARNSLNNRVTLFSNTSTGAGIFAGYAIKRDTIK